MSYSARVSKVAVLEQLKKYLADELADDIFADIVKADENDHQNLIGMTYGEWAEESLTAVAPIGAKMAYIVFSVENTTRRTEADFAVDNNHLLVFFGQGSGELPTSFKSLLVGLACAACACYESGNFEIGVVFKKGQKSLTYHTRGANYADLHLFHNKYLV